MYDQKTSYAFLVFICKKMTDEIKAVIEAELKKLSNRFYKKKQLDEESIDDLIEKSLDGEDYR